MLKPQTHKFFMELFTHLLLNTQLSTPLLGSDPKDYPTTRNQSPIEGVFVKASRLQTLSLGLTYYLSESFTGDAEQDEPSILAWAAKVAASTLKGTDMGAEL